jgi:uncharacterized protein YcbK (DUF882 family)
MYPAAMRQATHPLGMPGDLDLRPRSARVLAALRPSPRVLALVACATLGAVAAERLHGEAGAAPQAPPPAAAAIVPVPPPELPIHGPELQPVKWLDVSLYNANTRESAIIAMPIDGKLDPWTAEQLGRFVRCKRSGRWQELDTGLVAMLADLANQYPERVIEVVSGYRAPPYERRTSPHRQARALDVRVQGVPATEVRDYLWTNNTEVGIGYYQQQQFVHLDHRHGEPDIAWTQRRAGAEYRYHPWWSVKSRREAQALATH